MICCTPSLMYAHIITALTAWKSSGEDTVALCFSSIGHLKDSFSTGRVFPHSVKNHSVFSSFSHTLSVLNEVWVCAVYVCKHALICACAHACMSEQFDFFPFCVCSKRTWRHVPFLSRPSSVQPRQGLSRARIKGARKEEKVLPQLIWPL